MNILVYCAHPAQYHFLKHTIKNLKNDGHNVKVLIKTKDILENLLKEDGIDYSNIQKKFRKNNRVSILWASFQRTLRVLTEAHKFHADLLVGTDSSIAQAGWLLRKASVTTLEDDYNIIKNLARLTFPFSTDIVVPSVCSVGKYKYKKIPYEGYMKLAYLHPNVFQPDRDILSKYGISGKYILIRLAKLIAHHDVDIKGLDESLVKDIIRLSEQKGYKVFITSELATDSFFAQYQLHIHYSDIHHILARSSLLVSDSQSMSVEAAMLGVPSIRFSDFAGRISVLEELEQKYKLTFGVRTSEKDRLIAMIEDILCLKNASDEFQSRRQKMLDDKIDVSAFFTWFIENYPESRRIMKENPDYQYNFK